MLRLLGISQPWTCVKLDDCDQYIHNPLRFCVFISTCLSIIVSLYIRYVIVVRKWVWIFSDVLGMLRKIFTSHYRFSCAWPSLSGSLTLVSFPTNSCKITKIYSLLLDGTSRALLVLRMRNWVSRKVSWPFRRLCCKVVVLQRGVLTTASQGMQTVFRKSVCPSSYIWWLCSKWDEII